MTLWRRALFNLQSNIMWAEHCRKGPWKGLWRKPMSVKGANELGEPWAMTCWTQLMCPWCKANPSIPQIQNQIPASHSGRAFWVWLSWWAQCKTATGNVSRFSAQFDWIFPQKALNPIFWWSRCRIFQQTKLKTLKKVQDDCSLENSKPCTQTPKLLKIQNPISNLKLS